MGVAEDFLDAPSAPSAAEAFLGPATQQAQPTVQRSGLGEIGTALKRGVMVGLPQLAGQAGQYLGVGGEGMAKAAEERGNLPEYQLHPEQHGAVINALAAGAEMAPAMVGAAGLATGAVLGAPIELGAAAAGTAIAAGMATPFALQAGQQTLDEAHKKGIPESDAHTAAALQALQTFGVQTALGKVGGAMLGKGSTMLGGMISKDAAPIAEQTLAELTGQTGVVKPFLKQLPVSAAEAVALGGVQSGVGAAINQNYGIGDTTPWEAMKESVPSMLGLTAVMSPLGLAGRALNVRGAKQSSDYLASANTDAGLRDKLATQYYTRLKEVDPVAAEQFQKNAKEAIKQGIPLNVDPKLFSPDAIPDVQGLSQDALAGQGDAIRAADRADQAARAKALQTVQDEAEARRALAQQHDKVVADYVRPVGEMAAGTPGRGTFGQMSEFADLLKSETGDLAAKRAAAVAAAEKAKQEQAAVVENYIKAAVADTDARVAGSEAQKAEAKRRGVVSDVLNDASVPVERKAAAIRTALRKAGESVKLTDEEQAVIQKHADVHHAFTEEWEKPLDAAPNEMDVYGDKALAEEREAKAKKALQAAKDSTQVGKLQPGLEKQVVAALSLSTHAERAAEIAKMRAKQKNEKSNAFAILDTIDKQLNPKEETPNGMQEPGQKATQEVTPPAAPEAAVAPVVEEPIVSKEAVKDMKASLKAEKAAAKARKDAQMLGNDHTPDDPKVVAAEAKAKQLEAEAKAATDKANNHFLPEGEQGGAETPEAKQAESAGSPEAGTEKQAAKAAAKPPAVKGVRSVSDLYEQLKTNVPETPAVEPGVTEAAVQKRGGGRTAGTTDNRHAVDRRPLDADTGKVDPSASWAYTHTLDQAKGLSKNIWWMDLAWAAENRNATNANGRVAREILENGKFTDEQLAAAPAMAAKIEAVNAEIAKMGENTQKIGEQQFNQDVAKTKRAVKAKTADRQLDADIDAVADAKSKTEELILRRKAAKGDVAAKAELEQRKNDRAGIEESPEPVSDYASWRQEQGIDEAREKSLDALEAGFEHKAELESREEPHVRDALGKALSVNDLLSRLRAKASASEKVLIAALQHLNLGTKFEYVDDIINTADGRVRDGFYHPGTDTMTFSNGGATTSTVLHEIMHAATAKKVEQAMGLYKTAMTLGRDGIAKLTPEERANVESLWSLFSVYHDAQEAAKAKGVEGQYGLSNIHDFLAETFSNKEFQKFLQTGGEKASMWNRFVATIKNFLGIQGPDTMLSKAMDAGSRLMSNEAGEGAGLAHVAEDFNSSSPAKARGAVDTALSGLTKLADVALDKMKGISDTRMSAAAFKESLGWSTNGLMQHWANVDPVLHPIRAAIDLMQHAHDMVRQVAQRVEDRSSKYARALELELHKMGGAQARIMSQKMMTLGGEQSRLNMLFDKSYEEQIKADPAKAGVDKAYFEQLQQQWRALDRTHPQLTEFVREGARINNERFTQKTATIAANLLRHDEGQFLTHHIDAMDFMKNSTDQVKKSLDALFLDSKRLPENNPIRQRIEGVEALYSRQKDNPYYHLGRDGDFFVRAKFNDLDQVTYDKVQESLKGSNKVLGDLKAMADTGIFFRVATKEEANALARKMKDAAAGKLDISSLSAGPLAVEGKLNSAAGLAPALHQIYDALQDQFKTNPALRDIITREFMSMLPETSAAKALMPRRGVPGYDAEFLKNFTTRAAGDVQALSHLHSSHLFMDALQGMNDGVSKLSSHWSWSDAEKKQLMDAAGKDGYADAMARVESGDAAQKAGMVRDEFQKRFNNALSPIDNTLISKINSIGHTFYLALSPAFLLRTTMQPYHRTLPILGSRYGFAQSAVELGKATGVAMKILKNTLSQGYQEGGVRGALDAEMRFDNIGLSKREQMCIQDLHDRGELNLGQTRQLARMAMGKDIRSSDFTRFATMTAQYAEMSNRIVAALAAFRLAEKNDKAHTPETLQKNIDHAMLVSRNSMDTFESDQTARQIGAKGIAGKWTPLMTSFMNYNLQTMQQIARTVHDGMFNKDQSPEGQQRAKEARKEFAGLLGTTTVLAGGLGLPFANAFAGIYNSFANEFNTTDTPSDIRIDVRNFLADVFGKDVGEMLAHGVSRGIGVDLSTTGLQNLLPGSDFLENRRLLKDRLASQSEALMGPALNVFTGTAVAASKIADGYYIKGLEAMMPSGLKAYYKAAELATKGFIDAKENPMPIHATPWDVMVQATGFTPAKKAEASEAQEYISTNAELLAARKQVLTDRVFKNVTPESIGGTINYSMANPLDAIRGDALTNLFKTHAMTYTTGLGAGTGEASKRQVPKLSGVRFSNAGGGMP